MSDAKDFSFKGVMTALVSPFQKGALDVASFKKVLRHQIDHGIQGFVVNGTTGESPTLRLEEVKDLLKLAQSEVSGQVPVLLGTGSNSTHKTLEMTRLAADLKADGALVVTPYYNKPPQRGLREHYLTLAKAVEIPIILYNVPGRTAVSMTPETVHELSRHRNIRGIKEASGNLNLLQELKSNSEEDFVFLSGDDESSVDFCLQGGDGVISVLSHVIPKEFVSLIDRAREGDASAASEFEKYKKLCQWLFVESNPIPVKMALYKMGLIASPEMRLPLVSLDVDKITDLQQVLDEVFQ